MDKAAASPGPTTAPEPEATTAPEPTPKEPAEAKPPADSSPGPLPDKTASSGEPPSPGTTPHGEGSAEPKEGHRVPYRTYKNTRDELKALKRAHQPLTEENHNLKQQMEHLHERYKAELERLRAAPSEPRESTAESDEDWVKRQLGARDDDAGGAEPSAAESKRMTAIEERLNRRDLADATVQLDRDIDEVVSTYPSVDKRVLYRAVANNASIDLMKLGLQIQNRFSDIEQKAIAKYLEDAATAPAQEPVTTAAAPPRPRSSGNAPVAQPSDRSKGQNGWERMRAFLRDA